MIPPAAFPLWTDAELVLAARRNDLRAFDELVCRYRPGVVGVVYRMCGDPQLAEEAAQEAFIRAWQHLSTYNTGRPFRSWVYRIALNVATDALRRQPHPVDLDSLEMPGMDWEPEATLEEQERARAVRKAVLALPEASRAVLVLREYEGLSYAEIASSLDIPTGTVMSRLSYARSLLRVALSDYLESV